MKSATLPSFWTAYVSLEEDIKRSARKAYRLWAQSPLPENDLWIAAIALEHDLVIATRDAHFGEIDNLRVEMWLNSKRWLTRASSDLLRPVALLPRFAGGLCAGREALLRNYV